MSHNLLMNKPFTLLVLLALPTICHADYELRLNDGVTLIWPDYSIEGNQYCTRREYGSFCVQKRDVVSLKKVQGGPGNASPLNRAPSHARAAAAAPRMVDGIPVSGTDAAGADLFDEVMVRAMKRINCTAAAVAVADRGVMVHSRGYGWLDKEKKVPLPADAMIGIASCEKPVTAAAIKHLARNGGLDLDAGLFALLKVRPQGPVRDERIHSISIRHVLEHKAGWGPDPASGAADALRKAGGSDPLPLEAILSRVMTHPLKNAPGTVSEYCNFGYDTLRHVLERFSGKRPDDYFRNVLFQPELVLGFYGSGAPLPKDAPPLVWNAATGGPISASAPALLKFMRRYWLTGEPRDSGNPLWVMYGSLDGSTAIMIWRSDGIDLVALFNGRGSVSHDEISRDLQAVIDRIKDARGGSLL